MPFKLSNLNSNLALTLGYLNPALNNSALKSGKGTPFAIWAELPRISHYRGYSSGFMLALLAMSETISLP